MKTFQEWLDEQPVEEGLTGELFKAARLSADVKALMKSIATGSPKPIAKRAFNKVLGRKVSSRMF